MPIVGYSIKSISAERKNVTISQRLDISSTPKITSVEEREIELFGKQPSLTIGFEFESLYKPDIASIKFSGEVFFATKDVKNVLKEWRKKRQLPEMVDVEIKNFLFRKCLTLGINLSEELQLPAPLVFPVVLPKKEEEKARYIG